MTVAIVVGLGTGSAAVLFIKAIDWVTHLSFEQGLPQFLAPLGSAWVILIPIIGSLISGPIIAFWAIEAKGHGVPEVMQAITHTGRSHPPASSRGKIDRVLGMYWHRRIRWS